MRTPLASPTLSSALLDARQTGTATALVDRQGQLSYDALRARVERRAAELDLDARSIVVLSGEPSIEYVVTYLALVQSGHVPLLANDHVDGLARAWQAAIVRVVGDDLDTTWTQRSHHDVHRDVHPDLALLLSTSGSTGCPKLVRLSHRNLIANASAIADSLALDEHDRAITSLPLHYCYGLSVLHSHLAVGATVVLTGASIVDPCFRELAHANDITTIAGVPHTFDLLDRAGPERIRTPSLRLLTQAGGRLAPESVTRWVRRAHSWDADFVVMYGQTEATARMACLPSHLIARYPGAIGAPIGGGTFELRPVDDQPDGVGELIYRGDNVMMGYAVDSADLALGHVVDELATGDLARVHAVDEVYEIVGRRSRFVKPFGVRIDLDRIEGEMRRVTGIADIAVAGDDERLVVLAPESGVDVVARHLAPMCGLPASRLSVGAATALPRTTAGKIDYAAVMQSVTDRPGDARHDGSRLDLGSDGQVARAFSAVLGDRAVAPTDTFVTLGGDSLSYVECSIRLEASLGTLPPDWHLTPVAELDSFARPSRHGRIAHVGRIDTTILLRAVGICLVVATHMHLWHMPGGAHIMLAVAGYNLARFLGPIESPRERMAAGLRTAARAAVPTMIWVGVGIVATGAYGLGTLLLVNNYIGPRSHDGDHWHFWFIEVFVHLVVLSTLLLAIPGVRRVERRFTYLAPLGLLFATLLLRMEWAQDGDWYNLRFRTHGVAWFFVLGWLIRQSRTWWQQAATTVVCLAVVPGFFRIDRRDWLIAVALIGLIWLHHVPIPKRLIRLAGLLAASSMWIYITHFTFWPLFDSALIREVAYVVTIAAGVGTWLVSEHLLGLLNTWRQGRLHAHRLHAHRLQSRPIVPNPSEQDHDHITPPICGSRARGRDRTRNRHQRVRWWRRQSAGVQRPALRHRDRVRSVLGRHRDQGRVPHGQRQRTPRENRSRRSRHRG
ncbi:MAG: AMP-binding protein [Ilumatobacteraceae bacterium]